MGVESIVAILAALGAGTFLPGLVKMWSQRQASESARRDREIAARVAADAQEYELVKQSMQSSFALTEKLVTQIASLVASNEATARQLSDLASSNQAMAKGLQGLQGELLHLGNVVESSNKFMAGEFKTLSAEHRQLQERVSKLENCERVS